MSDNVYKETFTDIYNTWGFGHGESKSGPGSSLEHTENLRNKIIDTVACYFIF